MKLNEKIQKLRKNNNITQEELADKLSVSRQAVSKWESGMAYPDTEKLIQISKIFNVSLDELILDKDVEKKKEKEFKFKDIIKNILDFISKTIDMFFAMKFSEKLKCIFEMLIIGLCISLVANLSIDIIVSLICSILSFIPKDGINIIRKLLNSILDLMWVIFGLMIFIYIFKSRYLNYYEVIIDDSVKEKKVEKPILEKENVKVVIRDPDNSSINILKKIWDVIVFLLKIFSLFIVAPIIMMFVFFMGLLIISLFYVFKGLFFIGIILGIAGIILFIYLVLEFIFNLLFNHPHKIRRIFILFILSISLMGIGSGLTVHGFSKFNIVNQDDNVIIKEINMNDKLLIMDIDDIYVDNSIDNVMIKFNGSKNAEFSIYTYYEGKYLIYNDTYNYNDYEAFMDIMKGFTKKEIRNYNGSIDKKIYVNEENYNILIKNYNDYIKAKEW